MANNALTSDVQPSLLLTRPRASAERFVASLDSALLKRANVCISPLIEIVEKDPVPDLGAYAGVIITSAHGVAFGPMGAGRSAYCVGETTAKAAQARGWRVKCQEQTADILAETICHKKVRGPLAHLAGAYRRGEMAERLAGTNIKVDVFTLYDQVLKSLSDEAQRMLSWELPVIVPLFSPRTAMQFAQEAIETRGVVVVAISPAAAEPLKDIEVGKIEIAAAPTGDEMRLSVEMLLRKDSLT